MLRKAKYSHKNVKGLRKNNKEMGRFPEIWGKIKIRLRDRTPRGKTKTNHIINNNMKDKTAISNKTNKSTQHHKNNNTCNNNIDSNNSNRNNIDNNSNN